MSDFGKERVLIESIETALKKKDIYAHVSSYDIKQNPILTKKFIFNIDACGNTAQSNDCFFKINGQFALDASKKRPEQAYFAVEVYSLEGVERGINVPNGKYRVDIRWDDDGNIVSIDFC